MYIVTQKHFPIFLEWMNPFQEAWINEILIMVKKKKKVEVVIDEGWYSEAELKEIGWNQSCSQFLLKP